MTTNITSPSHEWAKKHLCKTVPIFLLALCAVTAYAKDSSKSVKPKLEKVTISGDHTNGDFVTFSYADSTRKEFATNLKPLLPTVPDSGSPPVEIIPMDFSVWNPEGDRLLACDPLVNKECALKVVINNHAISLPDACGNYSLLEAWDRYSLSLDGIELDNPALVEAFNKAEKCFITMQEACGSTNSSICNMWQLGF